MASTPASPIASLARNAPTPLLEQLSVGVLVQGTTGELLSANRAACALLGLGPEVAGRRLEELQPHLLREDGTRLGPGEWPAHEAARAGRAVGGAIVGVQAPGMAEPRWLQVDCSPQQDERGLLVQLVCTLTDATRVRAMARELASSKARERQSGDRLGAVIASTGDAVITRDREDRISGWNPAAETLFGWTAAEVLGRTSEFLIPDDRRDDASLQVEKTRNGKTVSHLETVRLRKDGTRVDVSMSFSPLAAEGGSTEGTVVIARDITEQRQIQASLERADRLAAMATLSAGVTHEINNPLAYIITNLALIRDELRTWVGTSPSTRSQQILEMAQEAYEGAERVRDIVRDLNAVARPAEQEQKRLELAPVLELSLKMVGNELKHRAQVVRDFQPTPTVLADEMRLSQVFVNLLLNAAQAMPEGRVSEHHVWVSKRTGPDGRAVVEVRDDGPGMPQEVARHLFEPFFTTKPVGTGTGLGLYTSYNTLRSLGGEISVETRQGVGTTFRILLPAAAAPALPKENKPAQAPTRGQVLVIDDDQLVLNVLQRLLRGENDVRIHSSARDALEELRGGKVFDVILCDMMMPDLTGAGFYEELRKFDAAMLERVIFLTGGAFAPAARTFLETVSNQRIEKPFDPNGVRSLVREAIRARAKGSAA